MITSKDATLVYETLLMSPGMTDTVKIPLSAKRKTLLMLAKIIEQGTSPKEEMREPGLLSVMDQQTTEEIKNDGRKPVGARRINGTEYTTGDA